MFKTIKQNITNLVRQTLITFIEARGCDYVLWEIMLKARGFTDYEIAIAISAQEALPFDSVTRARRKIQEKMPSLRNMDVYLKRQEKAGIIKKNVDRIFF